MKPLNTSISKLRNNNNYPYLDKLHVTWNTNSISLLKTYKYHINNEVRLAGIFTNLLSKYGASILNSRINAKNNINKRLLIKLEKYINTHYMETGLRAVDIANGVHLSLRQLHKKCKLLTELPIMKFLKYYRLNKASMLLETTDCKVTDIAISVGFLDCSNFYRSFKYLYNTTPREYRNKYNVANQ